MAKAIQQVKERRYVLGLTRGWGNVEVRQYNVLLAYMEVNCGR